MSFDPTIPGPTDLLSQSQVDLQINFSQANTLFGANHVSFDNTIPNITPNKLGYATLPADEGKHTIIIIKRIDTTTGTPGADPVTLGNEAAFYAKYTGTTTEPYYRYPSSGAIAQLIGFLTATPASPGSITFSNGIIVNWGRSPIVAPTTGLVINFNTAFNVACWSLVATAEFASPGGSYVSTDVPGLVSFTAYPHNNNVFIRYIAIGI